MTATSSKNPPAVHSSDPARDKKTSFRDHFADCERAAGATKSKTELRKQWVEMGKEGQNKWLQSKAFAPESQSQILGRRGPAAAVSQPLLSSSAQAMRPDIAQDRLFEQSSEDQNMLDGVLDFLQCDDGGSTLRQLRACNRMMASLGGKGPYLNSKNLKDPFHVSLAGDAVAKKVRCSKKQPLPVWVPFF